MKWLVLNPRGLHIAIGPKQHIFVRLDYPREDTGLAPDVHLAIQLTPAEARAFAESLSRNADEAEASKPRH